MHLDVQLLVQWAGCALGVAGSFILARNNRHSGWGFVAYLGSSAAWLGYGYLADVHALIFQHLVFTAVSAYGVWRWLIQPRAVLLEPVRPPASASVRPG